ncbi:MAG: alpha/beta hydrolase [Proteobacteria bacterium]|nr:alpha/beta hydrolase [Pseudomonadota bacterium]
MPLDPQAQALLDSIEQSGTAPLNTYSAVAARELYDQASELVRGTPPEPFAIETLAISGSSSNIPARLYRPNAEPTLPILVFYHGGGYTIGSLDSHDGVCRSLCVEAQCIVVSVDYRLAPEHKFPAGVDDAWAALQWVVDNAAILGGDVARVAVGGDSAGGNLAAVVCLKAKQSGEPQLVLQLLIYPGVEMSGSFPSHETFGHGYRLTKELISWFHDHYFETGADINQWQASPLNAPDHSGLPPAYVLSAGYDPLQDEDKAYAEKLKLAGVPVVYSHYASMMHGFITMGGAIDMAAAALTECADELRAAFAGKSSFR